MGAIGRMAYLMGWILLVAAVLDRVFIHTHFGQSLVDRDVLPRNFLQLSAMSFLICIASRHTGRD